MPDVRSPDACYKSGVIRPQGLSKDRLATGGDPLRRRIRRSIATDNPLRAVCEATCAPDPFVSHGRHCSDFANRPPSLGFGELDALKQGVAYGQGDASMGVRLGRMTSIGDLDASARRASVAVLAWFRRGRSIR